MIWIRWDKKTDRLRNGLRDWIMLKIFQEIDNIDGYDMYDDNLWKENRNGTQKVLNHIKK